MTECEHKFRYIPFLDCEKCDECGAVRDSERSRQDEAQESVILNRHLETESGF